MLQVQRLKISSKNQKVQRLNGMNHQWETD